MNSLRDYTKESSKWITFVEGDFYPDSLDIAIPIYAPVLENFGTMLEKAKSSNELLKLISDTSSPKKRVQLLRVFRKYVSPDTAVEWLKKKKEIPLICKEFGKKFRDITEVRKLFNSRPKPDEPLIAILNEYRDRGQKGYALTSAFFDWFETNMSESFTISGPISAGKDINLYDVLPSYPKDRRPVDFVITEVGKNQPLVIGLARYDSDRGGAQEDDRTSGYRDFVTELLKYSKNHKFDLKILFVNDGPGLLLGSMWKDYCEIEESGKGRVMVATLKMLVSRLTKEWILS